MLRNSLRPHSPRLAHAAQGLTAQSITLASYCLQHRSAFQGSSISLTVGSNPGGKTYSRSLSAGVEIQCGKQAKIKERRRQERQRAKNQVTRPKLYKGTVSPLRPVPDHIPKPRWAENGVSPPFSEVVEIHDAAGIEKMRAAGKLAKEVLDMAGDLVKAGLTTEDIDIAVHEMIVEHGAYPSPLNYGGFPKSVCTSLNECICHGIPDTTKLMDGDIINVDVTVYLDGHHGDTSRTFLIGNVSEPHRRLVEVTERSLAAAIAVCGPGVPFQNIGAAIQAVAEEHKLGVVKAFVGHGVGKEFHAGPAVLHYRNEENNGIMKVGQTFTIEPMLSVGSTLEKFWPDKWTAVTSDGAWTAQFEHTLLITDAGVDILTA